MQLITSKKKEKKRLFLTFTVRIDMSLFFNLFIFFIIFSDFDRHLLQDMDSGVKGRQLLGKTGDVLLGTVTLSLASLLTHRTGIFFKFECLLFFSSHQQILSLLCPEYLLERSL